MIKLLKILSLTLILSLALTSTAIAQGKSAKLLRGIANTFTGWVEIPKNIYYVSVEENIFIGITRGTLEGVGMAVVRTGCGVYETVTFPLELPKEYKPIMLPEYVIDLEQITDFEPIRGKTYIIKGDNEYEEI